MKKVISFLSCIILLVVAVLASTMLSAVSEENERAVETIRCGDYDYQILDDGTAKLITYYGKRENTIQIPSDLDGIKVTVLGHASVAGHLNTPNGTVFYSRYCKIVIPETITRMEGNPFDDLYIKSIDVSSGNKYFTTDGLALYDIKNNKLIVYACGSTNKRYTVKEGTKEIGESAFSSSKLESVVLPNGLTKIGDYAFSFSELRDIQLPDSIIEIGQFAFSHCELREIHLPASLKTIRKGILEFNDDIKEIIIPNGVTEIEEGAFIGIGGLEKIVIPDSLEIMGNPFYPVEVWRSFTLLDSIVISPNHPHFAIIDGVLFGKDDRRIIFCPNGINLKKYTIPYGIEIIGKGAFNCSHIEELVVPDSVKTIEEEAFSSSKINNLKLPEGIISIGDRAFSYCGELNSIQLPTSLEHIGERAFSNCKNLSSIDLPSHLQSIGRYAFEESGLSTIELPSSLQYIGMGAFNNTKLQKINIPAGIEKIEGNPVMDCSEFKGFTVSSDNKSYILQEGALISSDGTELVCYTGVKGKEEYVIPDGIKVICAGAFYRNKELITVTMPDTVEVIEDNAFQYSNIVSITMSNRLRVLGGNAFADCKKLNGLFLPDSLIEIQSYMFGCKPTVNYGSYAANYCELHKVDVHYLSSTDWLTGSGDGKGGTGALTPTPVPEGYSPDSLLTPEPKHYSVKECYNFAVQYINNNLLNPASLQIHSHYYEEDGESYTFHIDYSAMNRMGGYSRETFLIQISKTTGMVLFAWSY